MFGPGVEDRATEIVRRIDEGELRQVVGAGNSPYFISSDGEIVSLSRVPARYLDHYPDVRRRHSIVLFTPDMKRFDVADLVLQTFGTPRPSQSHAALPRDGDNANHRLANLYWGDAALLRFDAVAAAQLAAASPVVTHRPSTVEQEIRERIPRILDELVAFQARPLLSAQQRMALHQLIHAFQQAQAGSLQQVPPGLYQRFAEIGVPVSQLVKDVIRLMGVSGAQM